MTIQTVPQSVSYGGQCLTSESLGGRSANRGQCAQDCRLPYELVVDGDVRDLGEKSYLLSPRDLAAYDLVEDLAKLGVCSFKIEGRLKSPHYVAATTQTYRAAIDAAAAHRPFQLAHDRELELTQSFSRGFTHGFFDGVDHQELVHAKFPKSRGVRIGEVIARTPRGVMVETRDQSSDGFVAGGRLNVGDGVVFDEGHPEQDEQGGRIASVKSLPSSGTPGEGQGEGLRQAARKTLTPTLSRSTGRGRNAPARSRVEITFDRGGINLDAVAIGATVWKTDDPAVRRRLETTFARDTVARRVPVSASVAAKAGALLTVIVRDDLGNEAVVSWDRPLEIAQKFPLTEVLFREQFGRMGDTPFELAGVEGIDATTNVMVSKSVLNDLRRRAVEAVLVKRAGAAHPLIADAGCRNTVYNGTAQSAAEYVPRMKEVGIRDYRVELLRESPGEAVALLNHYARVLVGLDDGRQAWRQLRVLNQLGVTRGTLG